VALPEKNALDLGRNHLLVTSHFAVAAAFGIIAQCCAALLAR
jgi:hypothetical protein